MPPPVNRSSLDTLTPKSVGPSTGDTQTHPSTGPSTGACPLVILPVNRSSPYPAATPKSTVPSTGLYLAPICTPVNRRHARVHRHPPPTSPSPSSSSTDPAVYATSRQNTQVPSPVNRSSSATPTKSPRSSPPRRPSRRPPRHHGARNAPPIGGKKRPDHGRDDSQWIVTTRLLYHVQDPVVQLGRLQRALPRPFIH